MELPKDLREALDTAVGGVAARAAVDRLIEAYRSAAAVSEPILRSSADVAAYAAYRMPATFAAVSAALAQLRVALPDWAPVSQLDLGGGSGAAIWAATTQYDSLTEITVMDQVPQALALGRRLASNAISASLRTTVWREWHFSVEAGDAIGLGPSIPPADLVTISYLINELADQTPLLHAAAAIAGVLVVVEPGTPAGFERLRAARTQLIEEGLRIIAPCPHQAACPILAGRDWCHFAARIGRSSVHRRLKGGDLSYEDEKFAYVAAARMGDGSTAARVLRRPLQRKGLVSLSLCGPDGSLRTEAVSKRHGELYRAARDVEWGDAWPPAAMAPLRR